MLALLISLAVVTPADPGPAHAQLRSAKPMTGSLLPARCKPTADVAKFRGERASPRKLGDMPPANQIYTVYTVVDGCPQPVVVRQGIGGNPHKQVAPTRTPPRASKAN